MNDHHPRKATNVGTEPGLQPDSNGKHLRRDLLGAAEEENTEDTEKGGFRLLNPNAAIRPLCSQCPLRFPIQHA